MKTLYLDDQQTELLRWALDLAIDDNRLTLEDTDIDYKERTETEFNQFLLNDLLKRLK